MSHPAEVIFEGWIDKRGSRLHGWKRRYARLLFDRIVFSIDEHTDARGYWLLRDFLAVIKEATRFRQHPNCLCLVHPTSSNRYFEPASESHVWLDCIQSLLQHITPQIVRTRRVQKWLDQSVLHISQGSLEVAEAATLALGGPAAHSPAEGSEDTERKRAISQASLNGMPDSSPAVGGMMGDQSEPSGWKGVAGRTIDISLDVVVEHSDGPQQPESPTAMNARVLALKQQQQGHRNGHESEGDDESDVRSDEDDDNEYQGTHGATPTRGGSVPYHYAVTPGFS
eukprot:TRINITY_DN3804_c0_g1_i2.p1 TRINITY_DN3804_c0_g1~~TRINITY_DN3804_c0_g1_i2.p1  ORF type:complete len:283 (-),score=53.37 TRINITY_DN3804_c0_g1_i2:733-1581(-)